jgi:receptor expression-enhancing protein 5/6
VLGLGALYFFLVFFNIGANFLINTVGFAIPAYYSLDALFTTGSADDTQWLTYWVVYAFLTFFESAVNAVYWFPFYYTFKFVLVLWMALPQTKYVVHPPNTSNHSHHMLTTGFANSGAQVVFRSFLQPVFARYFTGGSTSANLRSAAEKAQ